MYETTAPSIPLEVSQGVTLALGLARRGRGLASVVANPGLYAGRTQRHVVDHVLLFLTAGTNRTAHHVVVLITVSRFADFVLSCVWMFQFLESVLLTELGKVDRRVMF
jgi:hypothetical protein